MVDSNNSKKRWYDQQSTVSQSVRLMESFPSEFQIALGESIIELAETQCDIEELMGQLRSLGPEKVLSLFKSKGKRRASDQLPAVHQAMNYLLVLPEGARIFIANHIIGIVDYLYEYFKICKEEGVQPSANIARQVCKAYLQGDLQDPNIFLTIVRQQIQLSNHYSFEYASKKNLGDMEPFPVKEIVEEPDEEFIPPVQVEASKEGLFIRQKRLPD